MGAIPDNSTRSTGKRKKSRLFYGWVILAVTIVTMIVAYGIRHSFSVFFPPILDEFGWQRGSTAFMFSLSILVYGLVAPVAGSVVDRWNPRRVMPLGALLLALATAGCALAKELWHFYLLFGLLVPAGNALTGWPALAPALANWFSSRRGMVMGIATVGSGLSFTMGVFTNYIISLVGWRWTFVVLACLVGGIVIPLILLLFYGRPEHKGLTAYGIESAPAESTEEPFHVSAEKDPAATDWTLSRALRDHRLWMLILSLMFNWGIGSYTVMAHQVRFAEDVGYSNSLAASVFGLSGIFVALGMVSGFIGDWLGRERTLTLATLSSVTSMLILISVHDNSQPWILYVYGLLFGFGAGLASPVIAAATADIFYGRHFGVVYGFVIAGMGIGGAIGPWLGGFTHDISGSYFSAFIVCMVAYCASCLCLWIAAPRKARKPNIHVRTVSL